MPDSPQTAEAEFLMARALWDRRRDRRRAVALARRALETLRQQPGHRGEDVASWLASHGAP